MADETKTADTAAPAKAGAVHVLFHETYTVKNDDADVYQSGQVYEMTPDQAKLFASWCDCEVVDAPGSQPTQPVAPTTLDPATQAKVAAAVAQKEKQKKAQAKSKKGKTLEDRVGELEEQADATTAAAGSPAAAEAAAPAADPAKAAPSAAKAADPPPPPAPSAPDPKATAAAKPAATK